MIDLVRHNVSAPVDLDRSENGSLLEAALLAQRASDPAYGSARADATRPPA
jgi:hypothetical protein